MKFDILNRWSGNVNFTAEIECDENATIGMKTGLAVKWARYSDAVLRDADLRGADLRYANLSGAVLSGADLRDADLSDAVLRDANLRDANLRDADLSGADLRDANLRDAVLRGAPVISDIHKAVYAAASLPGALNMLTWHCGTAHCRAGWVVTLAGDAGKAMESCIGTSAAAALIYMASDPQIERIPNFHSTNNEALADMARLAGVETGGA